MSKKSKNETPDILEEEGFFEIASQPDPHTPVEPHTEPGHVDYISLLHDWNMTEEEKKNVDDLLNRIGGPRNGLQHFLDGVWNPEEIRELISSDNKDQLKAGG